MNPTSGRPDRQPHSPYSQRDSGYPRTGKHSFSKPQGEAGAVSLDQQKEAQTTLLLCVLPAPAWASAGGKVSLRYTLTAGCHILPYFMRLPTRQARYFSNTVWCLTVWSVTVWQVLRDNTGEREGNGTDRFLQQHPTVLSHASLKRKKASKQTHRRHTQTLQRLFFLLLAFGNSFDSYEFLVTRTHSSKTFPLLQKAEVCFIEQTEGGKKKKKKKHFF